MSTKKLAKELGLLRQRSQSSTGLKRTLVTNQIFSYLIVIDFESTCWREKNNCSQEIIEFPAVLLNTSTGEVESEFHKYVQPQEHPVLSEFCTELTGITQVQVEAGIPLQICLAQFSRWLQKLQLQLGVVFPSSKRGRSAASSSQKPCTFLTWSDWDLGVCLQYECKRKQIHKPDVVNSWIDLRSTYRLFYNRKPKGLNGALQDLGIQFSGREHSGLDDARNTAQLAAQMMRDGCVMKITRSLERAPSVLGKAAGPASDNTSRERRDSAQEENAVTSNKPPPSKVALKSCRLIRCSGNNTVVSSAAQEPAPACRSLVSLKTLLSATSVNAANHSVQTVCPPRRGSSGSSLVMCSTVVGCISHPTLTANAGLEQGEAAEFAAETEDRCGSYDDVVLEADGAAAAEADGRYECISEFESVAPIPPVGEAASGCSAREADSAGNESGSERGESANWCAKSERAMPVGAQDPLLPGREACFAVPKAVPSSSKSNCQKTGGTASVPRQGKPDVCSKTPKTNTPSSFRPKAFVPEKTSTPNPSIFKSAVTRETNRKEAPKSSFRIYADSVKQTPASTRPLSVLSSLSVNAAASSRNHSCVPMPMKRGGKVTSPLCDCGRRAKRLLVSNGGPNHGRGFYCCAVRRSGGIGGVRIQKGCEFFKWEAALMRSAAPAAARSSVSLCQMDSTLRWRPAQGSSVRKSC